MPELLGKMRWYPGDALVPVKEADLVKIGQRHGVRLSLLEIVGKSQKVLPGGVIVEWGWEQPIDEATQSVVTIEAGDEASFRRCVRELIDTYRGPVPMWGMWGSSKRAEELINELLDERDGWT